MVNEHIIRDIYYTAVYGKMTPFAIFSHNPPDGIETSVHFCGIPFVFGQIPVIAGVNYGEFALAEWYPAKGIAVSNTAIRKYRADEYPDKPTWDGNNELNFSLHRKDRIQKSEDRNQNTEVSPQDALRQRQKSDNRI